MSKKAIPRETEKTKLTRAQRKEIDAVIRKYKGDGRPHTAQQSIPYEAMYPDGVCRVSPGVFSKCIEFADISYQLAQPDTQTAIFEKLCDLYNYVDASIHIQFSFLNRKVDPVQYAKSFEIAPQGDDFDDIRAEYTGILQKQLANGNNGMVKTKYLTFTIEAESLKAARARLKRIGFDLLGYFKSMGAVAHVMDGWERLNLLHGVYHPDGEIFHFDWKWLAPSGLSTKDFIAPSSLCFGNAKTFGMGGKYGAVSFLQILSPELSDDMLADFLNTESGVLVNLHVQAIEQTKAIKTIKRKITDLDAMKIQEQKKAVRSGYDTEPKVPLTPAQEESFLSFVQGDKVYQKHYDAIVILLGTGLRISELCGLTDMDLDFENRVIVVSHQLLRNTGVGYYIDEPKTQSGVRKIPMNEEVYQAFQRVIKNRKGAKPFIIDGYTNFLFPKQNGYPMTAVDYGGMFGRLVKKYNKSHEEALPKTTTPHAMRHTFCTRLANAGMNPKALQYIMGHSNITMTLNYYAHATFDSARAEMERLAA